MVKLFAHRGFALGDIEQNSIASLDAAVKENFKAIEFDIWFFEEKLVLKHDQPKFAELAFLPKFHDYLCFKDSLEYWLDFKNLDEKNVAKVLQLVKQDIEAAKINLNKIYFAPFITDYRKAKKIFTEIRKVFGFEVNLVAVCEELKTVEDVETLREFLTKNRVKFLSIFHKLINEDFVRKFYDIEFFAWTVNDLARMAELGKFGVENFATDKITPRIYNELSIFHKVLDEDFVEQFSDIEVLAWTINDLSNQAQLEQLGLENFTTGQNTIEIYEKNSPKTLGKTTRK